MRGPADDSGGMRSGFIADARAQSETIGVVLILGMVVLGMTAVVTFGSQALGATEDRAEIANAEQAMAQFDSKAAQVALGESAVQSVPLASGGGYEVKPNTGTITITHADYTGGTNEDDDSIEDGPTDDDQLIRSVDLGTVVYENGDTTIAYQGGGVWRKDVAGNSTMVSPPEFHYRDETLTLPVISVSATGSETAAGDPTSVIRSGEIKRTDAVYPDTSESYGATGKPYTNPVENGVMVIEVESQYYQGWAEYFSTRTEGKVSVTNPATPGDPGITRVELDAPPQPTNPFDIPTEGNAIDLRGVGEDHPLNAFSVDITDPANNNGFKHLYWSFYAQSQGHELEILFYSSDKQRCKQGRETAPLYAGVYYEDATGASHEWENTSVNPDAGPIRIACRDVDSDGWDEPVLEVNFLGDTPMRYSEITTPAEKWAHDPSTAAESQISFNTHPAVDPDVTYSKGSSRAELSLLVNHYFSLLGPEIDLTVSEKSPCGCRIEEELSSGRLEYVPSGGQYITYLHVTENKITVELE